MADADGIGGLAEEAAALEGSLGAAVAMTAAFDTELVRMRESLVFTGREVTTLSNSISRGLGRAFDGLIFDGAKLSDALKSVAQTMVDSVYRIALRPVENAVGGAIATGVNGLLSGLFPFEKGGSFAQGPGDAVCAGRRGQRADGVSDAERAGADGRGGARGDHALGARGGRAAGCGDARRGGPGGERDDQRDDAGCAGL